MSKYIKRDEVIQNIKPIAETLSLGYQSDLATAIMKCKESDVIEHRRGEWVLESLDNYKKYKVTCSCCGWYGVENYDSYVDISDFYFCPYCRADMRGDDDEAD